MYLRYSSQLANLQMTVRNPSGCRVLCIDMISMQMHLAWGLPPAKRPLLVRPRREGRRPQQDRNSADWQASQGETLEPVLALASLRRAALPSCRQHPAQPSAWIWAERAAPCQHLSDAGAHCSAALPEGSGPTWLRQKVPQLQSGNKDSLDPILSFGQAEPKKQCESIP